MTDDLKNAFGWSIYRPKRGGSFQKSVMKFCIEKGFFDAKSDEKDAVNMVKTVLPVQYFSDIGIENIYN